MLEAWAAAEKYGKVSPLRQLVWSFDRRDPITLLAHMHEIAEMDGVASRCAVLWRRLIGPIGAPLQPRIVPSDAAMVWAKARLSGPDPEPPAGSGHRRGRDKAPRKRRDPAAIAEIVPGVVAALRDGPAPPNDPRGPPAVPAPETAALLARMTRGWELPGATNHDADKATIRLALASDPTRVLGLALELAPLPGPPAEDPPTDRWAVLARHCRELRAPAERFAGLARDRLAGDCRAPPRRLGEAARRGSRKRPPDG